MWKYLVHSLCLKNTQLMNDNVSLSEGFSGCLQNAVPWRWPSSWSDSQSLDLSFQPSHWCKIKSSSYPKLNLRTQRKDTLWGQVRAFSNTFSMSVDWWSKWTIKWSLVSRSTADTSAFPSYKCIISINMKVTNAKTGKGSRKASLILSHRYHHLDSCFTVTQSSHVYSHIDTYVASKTKL